MPTRPSVRCCTGCSTTTRCASRRAAPSCGYPPSRSSCALTSVCRRRRRRRRPPTRRLWDRSIRATSRPDRSRITTGRLPPRTTCTRTEDHRTAEMPGFHSLCETPARGDCVIGIASFFLFFIQLCPAHPVRGRNSVCVCARISTSSNRLGARARVPHTHTYTRTVGIHTWRTRHKRECIEFCGWIDSDRREFHCGLRVDRFSGSQRRTII